MATIATFKVPKVVNEPNVTCFASSSCCCGPYRLMGSELTQARIAQHHYAKGSAQRAGLTAAIEGLQKKGALEVPLVIGGKEVRLVLFNILASASRSFEGKQAG